jgi:sulfonate transport system permease protein
MSTTNPGSPAIGAVPVGASHARERAAGVGGRRRWLSGWQRLISPVALLVVWQLVSVAGLVSARKLPPPTQVVSTAATLITTNSAAYGTLQHALLASLERMLSVSRSARPSPSRWPWYRG